MVIFITNNNIPNNIIICNNIIILMSIIIGNIGNNTNNDINSRITNAS